MTPGSDVTSSRKSGSPGTCQEGKSSEKLVLSRKEGSHGRFVFQAGPVDVPPTEPGFLEQTSLESSLPTTRERASRPPCGSRPARPCCYHLKTTVLCLDQSFYFEVNIFYKVHKYLTYKYSKYFRYKARMCPVWTEKCRKQERIDAVQTKKSHAMAMLHAV